MGQIGITSSGKKIGASEGPEIASEDYLQLRLLLSSVSGGVLTSRRGCTREVYVGLAGVFDT
jgi:hypothetical protein